MMTIERNGKKYQHCDNFIDDPDANKLLRMFLYLHRIPAVDKSLFREYKELPWQIFADYKGQRVACTTASRFGHVCVQTDLSKPWFGYNETAAVEELSNFGVEQ